MSPAVLKTMDLEELLDDLGIAIEKRTGADAYALCPHPDHSERKPSFHVCVESVVDKKGQNRMGWCNCWSHPDGEMQIKNFLVLAAKVRFRAWGRQPTEQELSSTLRWALERRSPSEEMLARRRAKSRQEREPKKPGELEWPPTVEIDEAGHAFREYLARRGISIERAKQLGVVAVESPGALDRVLWRTLPGVLFPIRRSGKAVAWYVRSIVDGVASKDKGRYPPGVGLQSNGVMWSESEPKAGGVVVVVEGIFDADRVARFIASRDLPLSSSNVVSVLGGSMSDAQARWIRTLAPPKVVVIGDGDAGGAKLAASVEERLGVNVVKQQTPPGTDPGDCSDEVLMGILRPAAQQRTRILVRRSNR